MATVFPASLDVFSTKVDGVDDALAADVNNLQDAVAALQAKVGTNNSGNTSSLDYKVSRSFIRASNSVSLTGNSVDFLGIPAWANRVTLLLAGARVSALATPTLRLGSGGIVSTGYTGRTAYIADNSTLGGIYTNGASLYPGNVLNQATPLNGKITVQRMAGNVWIVDGLLHRTDSNVLVFMSYHLAMVGNLDRLRLTTVAGDVAFDAGSAAVSWE